MKFCKDCLHLVKNNWDWNSEEYQNKYGYCDVGKHHSVSGHATTRASTMRGFFRKCGISAKLFEAKEK